MTKFNSQICTSREQSERLLALGLKKETADMHHSYYTRVSFDGSKSHFWKEETGYNEKAIPAWSLHRLIEMLNIQMQTDGRYIYLADGGFDAHASIYDNIIDCIEWLINGGYFNKEYLVDLTGTDSHQDMVDAFRYAFEVMKAKKEVVKILKEK